MKLVLCRLNYLEWRSMLWSESEWNGESQKAAFYRWQHEKIRFPSRQAEHIMALPADEQQAKEELTEKLEGEEDERQKLHAAILEKEADAAGKAIELKWAKKAAGEAAAEQHKRSSSSAGAPATEAGAAEEP